MSVKQTLREDLAEHAYQFSCRAADWSRSDFSSAPMRFEPLELHVVDALGQQEVPDYFQQAAKAITEDVSVMKGPHALEWICAVREEIESFKRLGVYEEVQKGKATSTPLPARLILVTKPNVHGGPARIEGQRQRQRTGQTQTERSLPGQPHQPHRRVPPGDDPT